MVKYWYSQDMSWLYHHGKVKWHFGPLHPTFFITEAEYQHTKSDPCPFKVLQSSTYKVKMPQLSKRSWIKLSGNQN